MESKWRQNVIDYGFGGWHARKVARVLTPEVPFFVTDENPRSHVQAVMYSWRTPGIPPSAEGPFSKSLFPKPAGAGSPFPYGITLVLEDRL